MAKNLHGQVECGIQALKRRLGSDGAALLREIPARDGEIASFEFPLPRDYLNKDRTLAIGFGYAFPTYGLTLKVNPGAWLEWPHVMEDGICLFGDRRPYTGTPERVVETEIDRIYQLVQAIVPSSDEASRKRQFDKEITYYWRRQLRLAPGQYVLLSTPNEAAELFALSDSRASTFTKTTWLAAKESELQSMECRLGMRIAKMRGPAKAGFFLPLDSYPNLRVPDARQLAVWLASHVSAVAFEALKSWLSNTSGFPFRVLLLRVPEAPDADAFIALALRGKHIDVKGTPSYGRRAGKRQPPSKNASIPGSLEKSVLQVLDPRTVHSRDLQVGRRMADVTITLVGVGSLGSAIAMNLARAGVGMLYLVDNDVFVDANLGRHVLGIDDLGQYKTEALRDRLQRDVPSVTAISVPKLVQENPTDALGKADLVIVSTADWSSESWLWERKAGGAPWAFLQVWSEPYAVAGHALFSPAGSAQCADRLFTDTGQFRARFTDWKDGAEVRLPGCGVSFIPGGPIGLNAIATMAARIAVKSFSESKLEQAWYSALLESPQTIETLGGTYIGPGVTAGSEQQTLKRAWPFPNDGASADSG